jgi:hypothetical protein
MAAATWGVWTSPTQDVPRPGRVGVFLTMRQQPVLSRLGDLPGGKPTEQILTGCRRGQELSLADAVPNDAMADESGPTLPSAPSAGHGSYLGDKLPSLGMARDGRI